MKELILAHKYEKEQLLRETYVSREGLDKARESVAQNLIKVIIGPRRAGKSVFAFQMLKDQSFAYLNFDDERLLAQQNYDQIMKGIKEVYGETKYLLFDEIQNLDKWELFVNRLQRNGYNIILTGSNSRLLSRELATHLTGRYLEFAVYPFSFQEFAKAKGIDYQDAVSIAEKQGIILRGLNEYITNGGYPEVVVKTINWRDYLTFLFESILFKDIVKRYNVRYARNLYDLALYLISNYSAEYSYTRLKNMVDFRSVHTVQNYVNYLEEAFLIFSLKRFSYKLKQQLKAPEKSFTYDTGMTTALKFGMTPDYGRLIENIIAIEHLRRRKEIYYYKDKNGSEVDFIIKEGTKIVELQQVCHDISNPETKNREIRSLLKAQSTLNADTLTIITWDYETVEFVKNHRIIFIPLWRWLLFHNML